jgi:hypothetical protein
MRRAIQSRNLSSAARRRVALSLPKLVPHSALTPSESKSSPPFFVLATLFLTLCLTTCTLGEIAHVFLFFLTS